MNLLNQKQSKVITDMEASSCQYPGIAKTKDGKTHLCWQEYLEGHDTVWASCRDGEESLYTVQISGEGEALKPVCVAENQAVWYAWGESCKGQWSIYYTVFRDGIFAPTVCVETGEALFYPCLYEKDGTVYLLWNRQGVNKGEIVLAILGQQGPERKEVISVSGECYRPSFCITKDGTFYVTYDCFTGSNYQVMARACNNGAWTHEVLVSISNTAWAACPQITAVGDKGLVCWYDFDRGATFSYHSSLLLAENGRVTVREHTCLANGIDWYQDVSIASNDNGEAVFSYSWGKTKLHIRRYCEKDQWSQPLVMTYDDQNFASNQKVLLEHDGTVHMVWQFANKNGHKPHRNAQVVHTWVNFCDYDRYADPESERESDAFCLPIPQEKFLDRIEDEAAAAWMKAHGYEGSVPVFGDIHGQSGMTDGVGEIDQYFHTAKIWGKLDFTALTDHDCYPDWLSQSEWEWIRTTTRLFNVDGELAALLAYEWTPNEYRYDFGHKNVYYRGFEGELFRSGDQGGMTPDRLFESLKQYDAMAFPHHPAASWKLVSAATDWAFHDEEIQRMVEIFSRHAPFEYYGNQSVYTKNNMQIEHCSVQDALARGYHMGVTAGSDSHQMEHGVEGGIVVTFVKTLTNEHIWDNLYNRFTYATTGAGILLSFRGNNQEMGSIVTARGEIQFSVGVLGTDAVTVEVLCNNEVIEKKEQEGNACDFTFTRSVREEEDFYYIRVTQKDSHQAWSSPIWVSTKEGEKK